VAVNYSVMHKCCMCLRRPAVSTLYEV